MRQQWNQMFAGRATRREDRCGSASKMGNGAGDIDAAATGFEHRCGTAQFSFGINLRVIVALSREGASVNV